jgi:glyoxylase-like metal-dependent hydrolase (beta-lactamase superfamily II)
MKWIEHGNGVFSKRYQSLDLNVGAIVCEDGLLIIDTRAHHRQARELVDDLKTISKLPVRWIINTHHHWDHTFGNGEFHEVDIWGHERCKTNLADHGAAMLARVRKMSPGQAADFDEVLIVPPNKTVGDAADVEFGGRTVGMRYLGRGHTDNDLVITVPDADVLFAGDLIENGAPPAFGDAFPFEWPDTVETLSNMITDAVVPGHGAPTDRPFVDAQQADLAAVAELARQRHADGMTIEAAAAAGGPFPEATLNEAFGRAWIQLGSGS